MKTLDRYLAGLFVKNLLIAILSLAGIFLFQALMGDMISNQMTTEQALVYHFLALPQTVVQMTPPAVLLATVLTLASLNRTNELIASYSIGVGAMRIMSLFLAIVVIISSGILILEDRIMPLTYKKRMIYFQREIKKRTDFFFDIKQDKIWYRAKNIIYNLQLFDRRSNTIRGMTVYTFDNQFNLKQVVEAERAEYGPKGWRLKKGTLTQFTADDPFPITSPFAEKDLVITETPKDFQEIEKEVESLRFKELYRYIQRMKSAGADTKAYEVKFHAKINLSFIPLVMCVLAIPFSLRNRREGGLAKDLGVCLLVTFFYWLFYSIGLSLGTNGALPPWLAAWLPSLIFAALAAALISRQRS